MKKVLIVDDRDYMVKSMGHYIRIKGAEVTTVSRYQEAKAWIMSTSFDAVIADIQLDNPSARDDGLDLISFIKWRRPLTKVFVMTGFGSDEIKQEAIRRGAYVYLEKPVDLDFLCDCLTEIGVF